MTEHHVPTPREYDEATAKYHESDIVEIARGSQAWNVIKAEMWDKTTNKIRVQIRTGPNGVHLALKANESVWTPTLDVTAP